MEALGEGHCSNSCDSTSRTACGSVVIIFCNVLEFSESLSHEALSQ